MTPSTPVFATILLMGGSGSRFASPLPKQFHKLAGKSIYLHTLDIFLKKPEIERIVLVCHADWISRVKTETKRWSHVEVIAGGVSRQESSYLGLLHIKGRCDFVIIHDAVRPLLGLDILERNCELVLLKKAVNTCIPSTDTIVYSEAHTTVTAIPKRSNYLRGQTPQTFAFDLLFQAHLEARDRGMAESSDDCQLVLALNHPVFITQGSEENIKVTTPLDLILAEQLLQKKVLLQEPDKESLHQKRFIVVGGSGGIGQAITSALEKRGAHALSLFPSSTLYPVDLKNPKTIEQVMKQIAKKWGPCDGLINAAGFLLVKPIDTLTAHEIEAMVQINLTGLICCCKWAPLKRGAHIINIASSSFSKGRKSYAVYSATKAAVVNFTEAFAEEREDLYVNALIPERTRTRMRLENFPDENPSTLLSPEDVAHKALSLLESTKITGSLIHVKKLFEEQKVLELN